MRLHQRGADLLVNLMDAEEHFDTVSLDEYRSLVREAVVVFGQLPERDIPDEPDERPATRPVRLL